jgi:4'-phosphopantetheinyl transferase EntD
MRELSVGRPVQWGRTYLLAAPRQAMALDGAALSDRERQHCATLPRSRRTDWCAGRLVARRLVTWAFDRPPHTFDLLTAPAGMPVLLVAGAPAGFAMSLSHAGDWVVAAACRGGSVGVDVCPLDRAPRVRRSAQVVFSDSERTRLGALLRPSDAAAAWALAEASAKAMATADGGRAAFWQPVQRAEIYELSPPAISTGCAAVWSLPGAAVAAVHTESPQPARRLAPMDM